MIAYELGERKMYNKDIRREKMTDTTNHIRTKRDIYNQFLAGRSTDDIASNLNAPRLRLGHIHSATGDQAPLGRQPQATEATATPRSTP